MLRAIGRWVLLGILMGWIVPASRSQEKTEEKYAHREYRIPQGAAYSVVFSRDGKLMASGTGAVIIVWDVAGGKEVQRMQLPGKESHFLLFAENGKTLIWNGGEGPMVRIFDVQTGKQVREFQRPQLADARW